MNSTQVAALFSKDIIKKSSLQTQFSGFLKKANKHNMDINDWIEKNEGWQNALPILKKAVFPYLKENPVVCEIGAGTGRFARHISKKLGKGRIILVDHSAWVISFLSDYFKSDPRITTYLNDGKSLRAIKDSSVDLIFCNGTFIELKLSFFYLYSKEFHRVLKKGGYCIFNYFDTTAPGIWSHIKKWSVELVGYFTYHAPEIIDKIFISAGFEIVQRYNINESTYIVIKKR